MAAPSRNTVLIAVAGLLVLAVVADQAGLLGRAPGANPDAVAPADLSRSTADRLAVVRATVEDEPEWAAAVERLSAQTSAARARAVSAVSAELASSRLRDLVTQTMRRVDVTPRSTNAGPAATVEGSPFTVVSLTVQFDAADPDTVYRLVDRLENASGVAINVEGLTVVGPGLGLRRGLTVTMTVEALAHVTGADA